MHGATSGRPSPNEEARGTFGVLGLGYVGLPLALEAARAGYRVLGFDVSPDVVSRLNAGASHIQDASTSALRAAVEARSFVATMDMDRLGECDVVSICVPTPLNKIKDPDLSYVLAAGVAVARRLRPGQLIILESTTYPGTTEEVLQPLLEKSGLCAPRDFHLCFSPERVDPGNPRWNTRNTPKVLGGVSEACTEAGLAAYRPIFDTLVPVASARAAELVKVYENTFRMVNIALVNELAQVCDRLDIDVWEVVDAAATKPFGFMKFTPGPGLGGHCIPLDPHYLSWKMRTLEFRTRLIELASEINAEMPRFVLRKIADALNEKGKPLKGSRVLLLGVSYKRDIDDVRESPALELIRLLAEKGAKVSFHDRFVPSLQPEDIGSEGEEVRHSVELDVQVVENADAVVVVTDHSDVDYAKVAARADILVDTRGVLRGLADGSGKARVAAAVGGVDGV
jgi:UDP-N-acetyl-D-glucosamine dehydrogenase